MYSAFRAVRILPTVSSACCARTAFAASSRSLASVIRSQRFRVVAYVRFLPHVDHGDGGVDPDLPAHLSPAVAEREILADHLVVDHVEPEHLRDHLSGVLNVVIGIGLVSLGHPL